MRKYSQVIEKIRNTKRIYLVDIDKIIFWVTLISFFWILVYKLLLINIDPLFIDPHNISANSAEITFSIFSSIVAAGIFYIVTIFLPKFKSIRIMINNLVIYVAEIDYINLAVYRKCYKPKKNESINLNDYFEKIYNDKEIVYSEFKKTMECVPVDELDRMFKYQISYFDVIHKSYSSIMPQIINEKIVNILHHYYNVITMIPDTDPFEKYFAIINLSLPVCLMLKGHYDLDKKVCAEIKTMDNETV